MMFVRPIRCVTWLLLLVPFWGQELLAASRPLAGREIFRQICAKCHGRNGEGVKGKYDDALHGDWSLEKLTRYIDKSMPEDAPEKCVGPDAESVARFIYDAFYSREARVRNHPARVELVRLTNRQYANTIADLLKHFTGSDKPLGSERGLRGSYRSKAGKGGAARKTFDRVDPQLNFIFGEESPDAEALGTGTNEINITWRGSILAEETGEYEFMVKSPNGARLWVNDEEG